MMVWRRSRKRSAPCRPRCARCEGRGVIPHPSPPRVERVRADGSTKDDYSPPVIPCPCTRLQARLVPRPPSIDYQSRAAGEREDQ